MKMEEEEEEGTTDVGENMNCRFHKFPNRAYVPMLLSQQY